MAYLWQGPAFKIFEPQNVTCPDFQARFWIKVVTFQYFITELYTMCPMLSSCPKMLLVQIFHVSRPKIRLSAGKLADKIYLSRQSTTCPGRQDDHNCCNLFSKAPLCIFCVEVVYINYKHQCDKCTQPHGKFSETSENILGSPVWSRLGSVVTCSDCYSMP